MVPMVVVVEVVVVIVVVILVVNSAAMASIVIWGEYDQGGAIVLVTGLHLLVLLLQRRR